MARISPKLSFKRLRLVVDLLHLMLSMAVVLGMAYILGRHLLVDPLLMERAGIDLARLEWLNQHFPALPVWHANEGGGIPLGKGASMLAYMAVILLHRLSALPLAQAYRLMSAAAVPATAVGIYLLGCSAGRSRTIGLLAAVFYLLIPTSWSWTYEHGFFTVGLGLPFAVMAILAFKRYYSLHSAEGSSGERRLWVVLFVVALCLAALTDFTLLGMIALVCVLSALLGLAVERGSERRATLGWALGSLLRPALLALLLLAFFLVPMILNRQLTPGGGELGHQLDTIELLQLFGLSRLTQGEDIAPLQFPVVIIVLCLLGAIFSPRGQRRLIPLSLTVLIGLGVLALGPLAAFLQRLSAGPDGLMSRANWLLSASILAPVAAGSGAVALADMLVRPFDLIAKLLGRKRDTRSLRLRTRDVVISALSIAVALASLVAFGSTATGRRDLLAYGARQEGLDLGDVWAAADGEARRSFYELVHKENWAPFSISGAEGIMSEAARLASFLPEDGDVRIDGSPNLASGTRAALALMAVPQVNNGDPLQSLISEGRRYQANVFYSREVGVDEYGNPGTLNGLAQWFGTTYVFLHPDYDLPSIYAAAGWEQVHEEPGLQLWRSPIDSGSATLTTRPTVLVTDNRDHKIFSTVFRLANDGLVPYAEALLVQGQERIDHYSLEQLRQFDVLFLAGFDYQSRSKAWERLRAYVEQGGSLYIDTGWQFAVPEWEFKLAPEVLPVARLQWTDYGSGMGYQLNQPEIAGQIDVARFKPLDWEGEAWRLSGASASDVRPWGQVVLSFEGRPLIVAGTYGQGKVVWSGMNLIGHAMYLGKNDEELTLLQNLLGWLGDGQESVESAQVTILRDHPDEVTFQVNSGSEGGSWLYWREAYHPNWKAHLADGNGKSRVSVHPAGPGFTLVALPAIAGQGLVTLIWSPSLSERAAVIASLAGLLVLAALILDGLLTKGELLTKLQAAAIERIPKPFLGRGSNQEWAEKKRAELQRGLAKELALHAKDDPETPQPSPPAPPMEVRPHAPGHGGLTVLEGPASEPESVQVGGLLENMDHPEDRWAEKALRRARIL